MPIYEIKQTRQTHHHIKITNSLYKMTGAAMIHYEPLENSSTYSAKDFCARHQSVGPKFSFVHCECFLRRVLGSAHIIVTTAVILTVMMIFFTLQHGKTWRGNYTIRKTGNSTLKTFARPGWSRSKNEKDNYICGLVYGQPARSVVQRLPALRAIKKIQLNCRRSG